MVQEHMVQDYMVLDLKGAGIYKFLERKMGGHKMFDNQNVVSHKMTTDSVFILFKKTDFKTILACLGGKVYRWWGGHKKSFVAEIGGEGVAVLSTPTFCKFGTPFRRKCQPPKSGPKLWKALEGCICSTNNKVSFDSPAFTVYADVGTSIIRRLHHQQPKQHQQHGKSNYSSVS